MLGLNRTLLLKSEIRALFLTMSQLLSLANAPPRWEGEVKNFPTNARGRGISELGIDRDIRKSFVHKFKMGFLTNGTYPVKKISPPPAAAVALKMSFYKNIFFIVEGCTLVAACTRTCMFLWNAIKTCVYVYFVL